MKDTILRYLNTHHSAVLGFWQRASPDPTATIEQHCDVVYALHLAGLSDLIDARAPARFADVLAGLDLPGWRSSGGDGGGVPMSVHNGAYAFGALNLLRGDHGDLYPRVLSGRTFRPADLIDEATRRPKFPWWLTHHHWRVSHWLGGVPSLLWSAGHSTLPEAPSLRTLASSVLEATDAWLTAGRGFIKLHRLGPVHRIFRAAYRLRHDPDLADAGGVAHILWINHVAGRGYIDAGHVLDRVSALFQRHRPFMETRPYCLDFDVVQIVRTAIEQTGTPPGINADRAAQMLKDLDTFLLSGLSADYHLHKLPGALATYHECAAICDVDHTPFGPVQDIIRRACWI